MKERKNISIYFCSSWFVRFIEMIGFDLISVFFNSFKLAKSNKVFKMFLLLRCASWKSIHMSNFLFY